MESLTSNLIIGVMEIFIYLAVLVVFCKAL